MARPRTKNAQCPDCHTQGRWGLGVSLTRQGGGEQQESWVVERREWQSTPWSHLWDWDLASPHLPVHTPRSHSCPCLSVTASGTTSASPGPLETACGKHSRMGRSSALGRTWHPGTPSSLGVCSSWGRSRWVPSQACCEGGWATQPPTNHPGSFCSCSRYLPPSRPCEHSPRHMNIVSDKEVWGVLVVTGSSSGSGPTACRLNTIGRHLQCPWESLHMHLGCLWPGGGGGG